MASIRLGLYGGAFDPIHSAHLIIAQYIKEELDLNKIVFIPAANPPHKMVHSPAAIRLEMVQESIANNQHFECSDIEIRNPDVRYSIDSISRLKSEYAVDADSLFWIIGSDNFVDFLSWKSPEKIVELCTLVVFPRNKVNFEEGPQAFKSEAIYLRDAPLLDISSTMVRSFVREGRSVSYLVPPPARHLIEEHKLYI